MYHVLIAVNQLYNMDLLEKLNVGHSACNKVGIIIWYQIVLWFFGGGKMLRIIKTKNIYTTFHLSARLQKGVKAISKTIKRQLDMWILFVKNNKIALSIIYCVVYAECSIYVPVIVILFQTGRL